SLQAKEDEKFAGNYAWAERMLNGARAAPPDVKVDQYAGDEFINRRGMDAAIRGRAPLWAGLRGRHQAIRKGHAPGQMRGASIIAIAGDEAADAPHGIAHGCGRAADIEHGQHADAIAARQHQQRSYPRDKSAKPGKAPTEPGQQRPKVFQGRKIRAVSRGVNDMPDLGSQNSGQRGESNHGVRINSMERAALLLRF